MLPQTKAIELYKEAIQKASHYHSKRISAQRQLWELELSKRIEAAASNGECYITLTKGEYQEAMSYVNAVSLQGYMFVPHHAWLEPTTYRMYWSYEHLPVEPTWSDRLLLWWVGLRDKRHQNQLPF